MTNSRQCTCNEFMRRSEILLAAWLGSGHIGPIVSLARFLMAENLRVTLAVPITIDAPLPADLPQSDDFRFVRIDMPATISTLLESFEWLRENRDPIATDIIAKCNFDQQRPAALISDMMAGMWSKKLKETLQISEYTFFPSPLTCIYNFQHMAEITLLQQTYKEDRDDEVDIYLPGIRNALKLSDFVELPAELHAVFGDVLRCHHIADGAIVQDLASLYPRPQPLINSIADHYMKLCHEEGLVDRPEYKVFTVGALCLFNEKIHHMPTDAPEIQWLNQQKPKSVVFAALGSWIQITDADTIELARGLELSGMNFLWAFRGHSVGQGFDQEKEVEEEVDASGLPVTFRRDVEDKGIILPWVNQQAVLQHPAIACFLTHCGWNSTMEALSLAGVPLVLMPLAAEQGVNARILEEEFKCGKKVWDIQKGRKLNRHVVAETIRTCASDEDMQKTAQRMKKTLREAIAPGGCVSEVRKELCARLVQTQDNGKQL